MSSRSSSIPRRSCPPYAIASGAAPSVSSRVPSTSKSQIRRVVAARFASVIERRARCPAVDPVSRSRRGAVVEAIRFTLQPRSVLERETDALDQRRMGVLEEFHQRGGLGIRAVLRAQLEERARSGIVVAGDLDCEDIGLVLDAAGVAVD